MTATLNLLKKLMVKRAKFSQTMCNLRSKQGTLQKFIRKKFCSFKKYTYLYGDSYTTLSTYTANQGGTFAYYNYNYHTHLVL